MSAVLFVLRRVAVLVAGMFLVALGLTVMSRGEDR